MSVLFGICPVLEKTHTLLYCLSPMWLIGDFGQWGYMEIYEGVCWQSWSLVLLIPVLSFSSFSFFFWYKTLWEAGGRAPILNHGIEATCGVWWSKKTGGPWVLDSIGEPPYNPKYPSEASTYTRGGTYIQLSLCGQVSVQIRSLNDTRTFASVICICPFF